MKTYSIASPCTIGRNSVFGSATLGTTYCFILSVTVNIGDNQYHIGNREYGNDLFVTVAHRGHSRKIKAEGPTFRKVVARALFPRATTFPTNA